MRSKVATDRAPSGTGPYSQGVSSGNLLFVSGQGPFDAATLEVRGKTIREQTELTLDNVKAVVEAAGGTMDDVVKVGVFLADIEDYDAFNEVYTTYFEEPLPARTLVECGLKGILVEIDAIADIKTE